LGDHLYAALARLGPAGSKSPSRFPRAPGQEECPYTPASLSRSIRARCWRAKRSELSRRTNRSRALVAKFACPCRSSCARRTNWTAIWCWLSATYRFAIESGSAPKGATGLDVPTSLTARAAALAATKRRVSEQARSARSKSSFCDKRHLRRPPREDKPTGRSSPRGPFG